MRARSIAVLLLFAAATAFGQDPMLRGASMDLAGAVSRYEVRLKSLTTAIKREAFIMGRLVQAVKELQGFQIMVAVERARDRVAEAEKRASEDPPAPKQIRDSLLLMHELLDHAHEQGTMAIPDTLQKEIMLRSHDIQYILFGELSAAEKERRALTEVQMKLANAGGEMDTAVTEALGTTFDYFRAGGK
jgi:hypothetical protein